MNYATTEQNVPSSISGNIERSVAPEPVNASIRTALLVAAGGAVAGSLIMQMMGRKHEALFVGQWAPTLVSVALWYQIVKSQRYA
jgi:hypothetical protein